MTEPAPIDQSPVEPAASPRSSIPAEIVWFILLLAFVIFVSAVRVMTFRNYFNRGRGYLWENYRELRHVLPGGDSALMWVIYFGILSVFLIGSAMLLWLALKPANSLAADPSASGRPVRMIGAVILLTAIGIGLAFWSGPRDDITGSEIAAKGGVDYDALPQACADFFDREADVRSGKLRQGQPEQTAAAECKKAIPTQWPTIEPVARDLN
jgi:hypothetical protein